MPPPRPDDEGKPGEELLGAIKPLAAEILKLQAQMKAAGLFANDRDLLECPKCGLQEDVTIEGILIACPKEFPGEDTGERFIPLDDRESWWRCTKCGVEFTSEGFTE
jgi:rubredoxin